MRGRSRLDRKSTRLNSSHTEIYTLSLHDALPIFASSVRAGVGDHLAASDGQVDTAQRLHHADARSKQVAEQVSQPRRPDALAVDLSYARELNDDVRSRGNALIQCGHSDAARG